MPAAIAAGSVCGDEAVDRRRRRKPARIEPDHLPVGRPGAGVVGLGGKQLGAADVEARLGLRHVGGGDVAALQPRLGLAQLLAQHFEVAALQFEDAGVAQQVHVGGGGVEQHGLLDVAQRLARGEHLALREPGAVGGLKAVEQVLRDRDADAVRGVDAALREDSWRRAARRGRADLADRGRQRLRADVRRRRPPSAGSRPAPSARFRRWRAPPRAAS